MLASDDSEDLYAMATSAVQDWKCACAECILDDIVLSVAPLLNTHI